MTRGGIILVNELSCDVGVLGVRPSASGYGDPENLSRSSSGPSQSIRHEPSQDSAVRLPSGPIPRANVPGQTRQALPPQDSPSFGSRFHSQSILSSGGSVRTSDAYGGTTTSTPVFSGPRPGTPSRDQFIRNGSIPGTPSSRHRGLPSGPSRPETPEHPPPPRPQGFGYPENAQGAGIPYHLSRRQAPPIGNEPSVSGLPSTNGTSELLTSTFNRTSAARNDGNPPRPAPLTLQNSVRSGFDPSPTTPTRPGMSSSLSPGFLGSLATNERDTGMNGTARLSDADVLPPKSSSSITTPLIQRVPPEPTTSFRPPQSSRLQPPSQVLSPVPKVNPISPNGPPPSAFRIDEFGSSIQPLNSALPSALPSTLPSALATSLPLRPVDTSHSRNARISFFDPPNQALLDRLLATDSAIVASSSVVGGDNEEESVRATLTNVEEMLDGFEWATEDIFGKGSRGLGLGAGLAGKGSAEQIEARLLDELMALEKVLFVVNNHYLSLIWCFYRRMSTRSSSRTTG